MNSFYFFFLPKCFCLGLLILCWIKAARVDILVLNEKLSAFTIEYNVGCELVIYGLCYAKVCSLDSHFLENFYHKYWILSKTISAFIEKIIWFCFVLLSMLADFWMLNHFCIPGINLNWWWYTSILMYCWNQFPHILVRIFTSLFIKDICL